MKIKDYGTLYIMNNEIITFITTSFLISSVSWGFANVYVYICAPPTLTGFLLSTVYMGSPVCRCISYCQNSLSDMYVNLWVSSGVSAMASIKKLV